MAAGKGMVGRRIAFAALVGCLVAGATGFLVSARSESNRARDFDRDTAQVNDRTRALQSHTAAVNRQALAAEQLQHRVEVDAKVLTTLDVAPVYSYGEVVDALNTLTSAVSDLVHVNSPGDVHGKLDSLLVDARTKLGAFEKDLLAYSANRDEFRSAVRAARKR